MRRAVIVAAFVAGLTAVVLASRWIGTPREVSPAVWDRASLPDRLEVCGRSYRHDALDRVRTAAEIETAQGFPPTAVMPLQAQPCIPGPCDDVADADPCDTVVYVRVGADAYVDYSLQGGP